MTPLPPRPVLERHVDAAIATAGVTENGPGALVGVVRDGNVESWAAAGLASVEHAVPISAATVFDIASVSKQMTATVAILLARDGALDLDADTRELVPELDVGTPVTLRHCLQHTAGLPDYLARHDLSGGFLGSLSGEEGLVAALRGIGAADRPPGTGVRYSNTGYVLAALAMRRATGQELPGLLADRVFAPLGMDRSRVRDEHGLVLPAMAFSYSPVGKRLVRHEMPLVQYGDGAVLTTLGDLARWQAFLADGRVLGRDIRDELVRPGRLIDGTVTRYGLGVMCASTPFGPLVEHSGGMYGYRSYLLSFDSSGPGPGLGVVALSNVGSLMPRRLAWSVLRELVDLPRAEQVVPPAEWLGTWFAPEAPEVVRLDPAPDRDTGLLHVGSQVLPVGRDRDADVARWVDDTGSVDVQSSGAQLVLTDRLGQPTAYVRPHPSDDPPPQGRWHGADPETFLDLLPSGEDVLVSWRRSTPTRFSRTGSHEGWTIWTSEMGCLLVREQDDGGPRPATLVIDGTRFEYVAAPFVGDTESAAP